MSMLKRLLPDFKYFMGLKRALNKPDVVFAGFKIIRQQLPYPAVGHSHFWLCAYPDFEGVIVDFADTLFF